MKRSLSALILIALAACQMAAVQAPKLKHFSERGLSFDYPEAIQLEDRSSPSNQHLVFQSVGLAQIMIVARYEQISTDEELATARREVVDSFIATMRKQIHEQDPDAVRSATTVEVAGRQASGVRFRAVLDHVPGNAEIYSIKLGPRLVVLSLIGTDKEIAASSPAWTAIRRSLAVAAPASE
jgi:hypothetical protein